MRIGKAIVAVSLCACLGACAGEEAAKETAPSVSLPPAPPPGEPNGLAGMDAQALRVAFGPPQFVRKDGSAEMWRYDITSCKAFFFLYANGGSLAVRHVETIPRGTTMAADETCLAQLRARTNAPVT